MSADERFPFAWWLAISLWLGFIVSSVATVLMLETMMPTPPDDISDVYFTFGEFAAILAIVSGFVGFFFALSGFVCAFVLASKVKKRRFFMVPLAVGSLIAVGLWTGAVLTDTALGSYIGLLFAGLLVTGAGSAWLSRLIGGWLGWTQNKVYPKGHCQACGYSLRHLDHAQDCPECGTTIDGRAPQPESPENPQF